MFSFTERWIFGVFLSTLDRRSPVVFPLRQTGASEKKSGAISSKVGTIADCMCNICMLFYMQCNIIYIYISSLTVNLYFV